MLKLSKSPMYTIPPPKRGLLQLHEFVLRAGRRERGFRGAMASTLSIVYDSRNTSADRGTRTPKTQFLRLICMPIPSYPHVKLYVRGRSRTFYFCYVKAACFPVHYTNKWMVAYSRSCQRRHDQPHRCISACSL